MLQEEQPGCLTCNAGSSGKLTPLQMASCSPRLGLWLLLLLQDIQGAPQPPFTSSHSCDTLKNGFYDETLQRCCYQCPSGYAKKKSCPMDPDEDCMRCGPEQYLNESPKPRCDACVLCTKEFDLVEKAPCSFNSSRVCECRPGMFCQTAAKNTCMRCQQHTACKPGFGVKIRGTPEADVSCEECPPGTFSDQTSSTDICKPHTDCAKLNKVAQGKGNATHDQVCTDQLPSDLTPDASSIRISSETNDSDVLKLQANLVTPASILSSATTETPSSTPEEKALAGTSPTSAKGETTTRGLVFWGGILSVMVLPVGLLSFWQWKVCKKRILILKQKQGLISSSRDSMNAGFGVWNVMGVSAKGFGGAGSHMLSSNVSLDHLGPSRKRALSGSDLVDKYAKITLTTDKCPEEEELADRTPPLETNNNLISSAEKAAGPVLSLTEVMQSSGKAPDCPIDSRVRDHTNNQIGKIFIMNADTVIVGSSKTPDIKNCTARGYESDVDIQEKMEEELPMHYPEQETEVFPGDDVMVPVEEEGKEFHHPTTATEK